MGDPECRVGPASPGVEDLSKGAASGQPASRAAGGLGMASAFVQAATGSPPPGFERSQGEGYSRGQEAPQCLKRK